MSDEYSDLNKMSLNAHTVDENIIDTDDILNELENEEMPSHIREARLNELVLKSLERQFKDKNSTASIYGEISEEDFLKLTTNNKKCIVHFFHPDFRRCDIINTHLQKLSVKYADIDIRFAKVNVDKAKFFVTKLKIQVLPAIMCFVDGVVRDKIIGFDELGGNDNFPVEFLERRLQKKGILPTHRDDHDSDEEDGRKRSIFRRGNNNDDTDSD